MARGEPQAVDEVLQEVALALVKGKSLPNDDSRIGPWLYRVAVRQTLLYRRKMGRRRKLQDRFVEAKPPVDHDPEELKLFISAIRKKIWLG